MKKPITSRSVLEVLSQEYIKGKALDLGAGKAKYKETVLRTASEYVAFDCFESEHIDVTGDAHKLPFQDNVFDTIICISVIEHVERPWIVAKEMIRVLKLGGHCIVCAPFIFAYHSDPDDYFRFTMQGLSLLFKDCEIQELDRMGGLFSVIDSAWRTSVYDTYKKKHGFINRNCHRVVNLLCTILDRFIPWPSRFYPSSYIVVKKN